MISAPAELTKDKEKRLLPGRKKLQTISHPLLSAPSSRIDHCDDDDDSSNGSDDTDEMIREFIAAKIATDTNPESNDKDDTCNKNKSSRKRNNNCRGNKTKKNSQHKNNSTKGPYRPNSLDSLRERVSDLMSIFEQQGWYIPIPESSNNGKVWSSRIYGADRKRQRKNAERQVIVNRIQQLEHCLKEEHGIKIKTSSTDY